MSYPPHHDICEEDNHMLENCLEREVDQWLERRHKVLNPAQYRIFREISFFSLLNVVRLLRC